MSQEFKSFFLCPEDDLARWLTETYLQQNGNGGSAAMDEAGNVIFTRGVVKDVPVPIIMAHLDTVLETPKVVYEEKGKYWARGQLGGDDRAGVYAVAKIISMTTGPLVALFTRGEESGGKGARELKLEIEGAYIVAFDRRNGTDAVFYTAASDEYEEAVLTAIKDFGFTRAVGTWSDCETVARDRDCSSVNLSVGYYEPHTEKDYVLFWEVWNSLRAGLRLLATLKNTKFKCPAKTTYSYAGGYADGYYQNSHWKTHETSGHWVYPDGGTCASCGCHPLWDSEPSCYRCRKVRGRAWSENRKKAAEPPVWLWESYNCIECNAGLDSHEAVCPKCGRARKITLGHLGVMDDVTKKYPALQYESADGSWFWEYEACAKCNTKLGNTESECFSCHTVRRNVWKPKKGKKKDGEEDEIRDGVRYDAETKMLIRYFDGMPVSRMKDGTAMVVREDTGNAASKTESDGGLVWISVTCPSCKSRCLGDEPKCMKCGMVRTVMWASADMLKTETDPEKIVTVDWADVDRPEKKKKGKRKLSAAGVYADCPDANCLGFVEIVKGEVENDGWCPLCGTRIVPKGDAAPLDMPTGVMSQREDDFFQRPVVCPYCKSPIYDGEDMCPTCGEVIHATKKCPGCGIFFTATFESCPYCNSALVPATDVESNAGEEFDMYFDPTGTVQPELAADFPISRSCPDGKVHKGYEVCGNCGAPLGMHDRHLQCPLSVLVAALEQHGPDSIGR